MRITRTSTPDVIAAGILDPLKDHLRITGDYVDKEIVRTGARAIDVIQNYTNRQLLTATFSQPQDCFPYRHSYILPWAPLISVESITYMDSADTPGQTFDGSLTATITAATPADPVEITAAAHGFIDGDLVTIAGVVGMTEINDREFRVTNAATNTFDLAGEDGTGHTAYTSGGTATSRKDYEVITDTEPGLIRLRENKYWPTDATEVVTNYTAGYGTDWDDLPDDAQAAVLLITHHLYYNRSGEPFLDAVQSMLDDLCVGDDFHAYA